MKQGSIIEVAIISLTCARRSLALELPHHRVTSDSSVHQHYQEQRRVLLQSAAATCFGVLVLPSHATNAQVILEEDGETSDLSSTNVPSSAVASEIQRPYAPMEALVPAMQQRLALEQVSDLIQKLCETPANDEFKKIMLLEKLQALVEPPPSTYTSSPSFKFAVGATKRYDSNLILTQSSKSTISSDTATMKLSGTATRAAMNLYTANLRFGESYTLTASPAEKSRMLRTKGRFPDVKQVITSDLDLRDLYRNLVQTTLDDLAAELYQEQPTSIDTDELKKLATEATTAFNKWLSFIDEKDLNEARAQVVVPQ